MLYISGDTKALEKAQNEVLRLSKGKRLLAFHDYSNWNVPSRNVHACKSDMVAEYTREYRDNLIHYHTGESFNEEWQTV